MFDVNAGLLTDLLSALGLLAGHYRGQLANYIYIIYNQETNYTKTIETFSIPKLEVLNVFKLIFHFNNSNI